MQWHLVTINNKAILCDIIYAALHLLIIDLKKIFIEYRIDKNIFHIIDVCFIMLKYFNTIKLIM